MLINHQYEKSDTFKLKLNKYDKSNIVKNEN